MSLCMCVCLCVTVIVFASELVTGSLILNLVFYALIIFRIIDTVPTVIIRLDVSPQAQDITANSRSRHTAITSETTTTHLTPPPFPDPHTSKNLNIPSGQW